MFNCNDKIEFVKMGKAGCNGKNEMELYSVGEVYTIL